MVSMRQANAKWKDPEYIKAYMRKYGVEHRAKHLNRYRSKVRNRRALLRGNGGKHTAEDITRLLSAQKGKCAYCRISVGNHFHVDHIMPIKRIHFFV